ncbi:MAG: ABC transporter permease [Saprospiraceae bacterium]|nr:ABC transporter permease [Saprospiraceae bacterium]MCF8248684.1 ABC transporter permease [Saprospiraceae bacterium]MCF8278826.1 ABC transporter permease [Bacteroidales bacterium]MCF8310626.1 ABC transporter permease [Saprospiraceae bacterium]MCF8439185.1 ABC transporter permease [Saprospiraceae bacterium]
MKIFLAFVKKEFYHILRDRRTLIILMGMPVALVLLFGYVVTNEFKDASVVVLDNAHDDLSGMLRQQLEASGHLKVKADLRSYEEIAPFFQNGEAKMAIVIPPNFGSDFNARSNPQIQLIADGSEPNYALTLVNYASQIIQQFQQNQAATVQLPYRVRVETSMVYNPQLRSAYTFVPGVIALILLIISAMMTSLTIAREKELGTMDLLLVSPLPPLLIIVGKVVPYAVLSFLSAVMVLVLGYFVFKVPIVGSLALLLAVCMLYLIVSLALGVLISTKAESQQAAMMFSLFSLMMPTMLLSGFIFPISSMPTVLQVISKIIPATYFIEVLKGVMLKGLGVGFIWKPLAVLCGMVVLLLGLALANFKIQKK